MTPVTTVEQSADCPYCAGEMCARFDGLGCQHDAEERHGYPPCFDPSAHTRIAPTVGGNLSSARNVIRGYHLGKGGHTDEPGCEICISIVTIDATRAALAEVVAIFGDGDGHKVDIVDDHWRCTDDCPAHGLLDRVRGLL